MQAAAAQCWNGRSLQGLRSTGMRNSVHVNHDVAGYEAPALALEHRA
jgi:hypothetical protein